VADGGLPPADDGSWLSMSAMLNDLTPAAGCASSVTADEPGMVRPPCCVAAVIVIISTRLDAGQPSSCSGGGGDDNND